MRYVVDAGKLLAAWLSQVWKISPVKEDKSSFLLTPGLISGEFFYILVIGR